MDIRMDIALNIAFHIRWLIPFSRWLTLEVDSRNYGLGWRNGENMCARINGLKLHGYPHGYWIEYCVPYSLVDSILALADFRGGVAELRTWMISKVK